MQFARKGAPLSGHDFSDVVATLGVSDAAMWAVIEVETRGAGFFDSRKPAILFERHVFRRLTGGKYDASHPDISDPTWGGYGASGEHQYQRLQEAMALDEDAALCSVSWGLGQVMGENWKALGYLSIQQFVGDMCESEKAQLRAMGAFIQSKKLGPALASSNWDEFALHYNGGDYKKNQYDLKLSQHYEKLRAGPLPDLRLRAMQSYLTFLAKERNPAFDPNGIDGWMGRMTRSAMQAFQQRSNLPVTEDLDDATYAAIEAAALA
jgi:hypothetical protein